MALFLPEGWTSWLFLSLFCSFTCWMYSPLHACACPTVQVTPTKWKVKSSCCVERNVSLNSASPCNQGVKTGSVCHVAYHPCSSWWCLWDFIGPHLVQSWAENDCDHTTDQRPLSWNHSRPFSYNKPDLCKAAGHKWLSYLLTNQKNPNLVLRVFEQTRRV